MSGITTRSRRYPGVLGADPTMVNTKSTTDSQGNAQKRQRRALASIDQNRIDRSSWANMDGGKLVARAPLKGKVNKRGRAMLDAEVVEDNEFDIQSQEHVKKRRKTKRAFNSHCGSTRRSKRLMKNLKSHQLKYEQSSKSSFFSSSSSPSSSSTTPMAIVPTQPPLTFNPMEALLSAEPLDIALHTFQFLSYRDLVQVTRVCKSWKTAVVASKSLEFASAEKKLATHDIIDRLYKLEATMSAGFFVHHQSEISSRMRAILADWLLQVNNEFENSVDTGYLAMQVVDRYLGRVNVKRNKLQLVGIASLLIASKMEETHYPDLGELLYLCDNIYTRDQLVEMESTIMRGLDHTLHSPTLLHFLRYYMKESPCSKTQRALALYLSEQSLLDYRMLEYRPSRVAMAIFLYVKHEEFSSLNKALDLFNVPLHEVYAPASTLVSMISCASGYFLQATLLRFTDHADHEEGLEDISTEFVAWLAERYPGFASHLSAFSLAYVEPTKVDSPSMPTVGSCVEHVAPPQTETVAQPSPTVSSASTDTAMPVTPLSRRSKPITSSSSLSSTGVDATFTAHTADLADPELFATETTAIQEDISFAAYIANLADPFFFTEAAAIQEREKVSLASSKHNTNSSSDPNNRKRKRKRNKTVHELIDSLLDEDESDSDGDHDNKRIKKSKSASNLESDDDDETESGEGSQSDSADESSDSDDDSNLAKRARMPRKELPRKELARRAMVKRRRD